MVFRDNFLDSNGIEDASISFVEVLEYDSLKVLRVAEILTRDAVENEVLHRTKHRVYLYHFYIPGDTASLDEEMLDELAYTHPSVQDPSDKLLVVPGGWVVKASFSPDMWQPREIDGRQSQFYMPRAGTKVLDLR